VIAVRLDDSKSFDSVKCTRCGYVMKVGGGSGYCPVCDSVFFKRKKSKVSGVSALLISGRVNAVPAEWVEDGK
jgi:uncharacterized paraquat-inducible protein A